MALLKFKRQTAVNSISSLSNGLGSKADKKVPRRKRQQIVFLFKFLCQQKMIPKTVKPRSLNNLLSK